MFDESGYVDAIWLSDVAEVDACVSPMRDDLSVTVPILLGGSRNSIGVLSDVLSTVIDLP